MSHETILPNARLGEIQSHLHLHGPRLTWTLRLRCRYCNQPWRRGGCQPKRDGRAALIAADARARSTTWLPVGLS
ncbi:hypothetical protein [Natronoglycomyces albus]|uniref:Uncharacterized protein n=1 Tax=Natronoglycomyces albus TaxID=2811108 RepID=A0A895XVU3_9ACTN|nr:hypothetical protein [Natronoglycomyces albus]QSB05758.1 hypothetical protein JQS30_02170 [Natronoglycomyces albus]